MNNQSEIHAMLENARMMILSAQARLHSETNKDIIQAYLKDIAYWTAQAQRILAKEAE